MAKNKLELTWIGKDQRPKLEPRILIENRGQSFHATRRMSADDIFDNRLIFGDNLLALKALTTEFVGRIKCIYVDPPYNTPDAVQGFYEDGLEHSIWLSLMRERFELLRTLLRRDGLFFCQLNDDEMAYAKVLLDEVFGRNNFLNQVSVKMKQTAGASGGGEDKRLKKNIEYILIYARDRDGEKGFKKFNDVFDEEDLFEVIEDMRASGKSWKYTRIMKDLGKRQFFTRIEDGSGEPIDIFVHAGVTMEPISQVCIDESLSEQECYLRYFDRIFRDTNAQSSIRTRVMQATAGTGEEFFSIDYIPTSGRNKGKKVTLYYKGVNCDLIAWLSDVAVKRGTRLLKLEKVGTYWEGFPLNNLTKEGAVQFPHGKKPEALIQKILELSTQRGDWTLDSFAGSGTTGAVAHKMGRRWIMVELGEHCHTHIIPRLKRVINGEDTAGITKAVGWRGGGGFRFYRLASSLLELDRWGNWVISMRYNAPMLAEAMCKLEGFTYAPSQNRYWEHGHSTERDFIYVTTQKLSQKELHALSEEVGPERSLLICCTAFRGAPDQFENLTLKKIPKSVRDRCEWGRDDYSLAVTNLSAAPADEAEIDATTVAKNGKRTARKAQAAGQADLFASAEGPQT